MAYQVISQNNTTTTLADENGNIIHVPARVSLATSTDYTITKVNNTTATLEDGNGNIIRDVPCVAVLFGGEGGGGTVDYSKTVQKTNTMPTADATNAGQVFMYTGATDANYTQNYIYKNVKTATYTGTVSFEAATLSGTTVACSGDNFANFLTESGVEPLSVVSGTMTFDSASELWALVGKDSDGNTVLTFQEYQQDFVDAGFTFTGTPQDGDVVAFTCTVEEASATYAWTRIDVQPAPVIPDPLPSQTGQSGKFLTTDGTDASWSDKPLVNTATGADALTILGTSTNKVSSINIGVGSRITANNGQGVAIGPYSLVEGTQGGVAIGPGSRAGGTQSISLGQSNRATGRYSIQMGGYSVTNSDDNTFKVGNANGNFEMMSADGTIPTDRLVHAINKYSTMPTAASTNEGWIVQYTGTTDSTYTHGYIYECVSDGQATPTYSWVQTNVQPAGGGSSYTAGTGIDITSGVISVTSPTVQNTATGTNSLTILGDVATSGIATNVGVYSKATQMGACAFGAVANASGMDAVAIGCRAKASGGQSIAIGQSTTEASAMYAIAIGGGKATANYAIQIGGTQTNSDALTLKIGFAGANYELLDGTTGTIPTARLTKVNTTVTLTAAGWSSNTQTVSVTGMTATGVVMVSPDPTDQSAYTSAGILATAQAAGSLTFTCDTVPSGDLSVNVVML